MKTALLVAGVMVLAVPSCTARVTDHPALTADLACETAYAVTRSRKTFSPAPPTPECCGKCTGGKVKSGDGLAWIPCPCPETCRCKAKP
jgi:hypothetical protein